MLWRRQTVRPPRQSGTHRRRASYLLIAFFAVAIMCTTVWGVVSGRARFFSSAEAAQPHIVVAYERIPQQFDGAELYLTVSLAALAKASRITFLARSTSGSCLPSAADERALRAALPGPTHAIVRGEDATIGSVALAALLHDAHALLLPISVLEDTCGSGTGGNASAPAAPSAAEQYASYARQASPAIRIAVFTFDAHAARARSLAAAEDVYPALRAVYRSAAASLERREAAVYAAVDALVVLTAEDAIASPAARGMTLVAPYRFTVPAALAVPTLAGRAVAVAAAAAAPPGWVSRRGFLFVGSGDNPTNALALRAFLRETWPVVRKALPEAQLRVVGRPPRRICAAHGVWCGGWADGTPFEGGRGGVTELGLVEDISVELSSARVGIAPMTCGTGVNTKVGLMLAAGLPVVGTAKAARGYGGRSDPREPSGIVVAPSLHAMAAELVFLHESEGAWGRAREAALGHAADLGAGAEFEGAPGLARDVQVLLQACGVGPGWTAGGKEVHFKE